MRLGRIGYINCYPVYGAIDRGVTPLAAELVTGTPSELNDLLAAGRHACPRRYERGDEGERWTGLPFVFAMWAARRAADPRAVRAVHHTLLAARDWGLAHLDLLAEAAARATGVGVTECRSYLAGLDYALTDTHLAGLTDFFRRLAARGLVPDGSLQFLQVA